MSGVPKIEITESVETLKFLMKRQKTALNHAKVQSLYLLKINVAETVRYLAVIMGRSESTVHYWLRPIHEKQKPGVIVAFKNYFPHRIKGLINDIRDKWGDNYPISYWFQDETRLGYRTESGQKITRAGVQPKQILQWHYSYYYIYGLVDPVKGRSFFYEFSHFNSECLGLFLEQFTQEYQDEIHIIQLDNAPCHTAHKLIIPENVILFLAPSLRRGDLGAGGALFQPPYCPELNPIERVWQYIKQQLKNLFFTSLEDVKDKVAKILNSLSEEIIHSLTGWQYILDALSL